MPLHRHGPDHEQWSILDRLADKMLVGDDCWNWTGSLDQGYGRFRIGGRAGRAERAHRVLYELMVGPIPEGMEIDHLCRNTRCVRPDHLEAVTHQVNVVRGGVAESNRRRAQCR